MPVRAKNATPHPRVVSVPCERGPCPTWAGAAGENTRSFRPGRRLPTDHGGQGRPSSCSSTGAEGTPGDTVAESGAGSGWCPPRSACCQQPGRRSQLRGWRGSAGLAAGSRCLAAAVGVPHQKGKREKRRLHLPGPSGAGFNPDSSGSAARMVQGPELLPQLLLRKGETKLGMPNTFKFSRRFYSPSLGFLKQMIRKMTRKTTVPQPTAMRMTRYRGR